MKDEFILIIENSLLQNNAPISFGCTIVLYAREVNIASGFIYDFVDAYLARAGVDVAKVPFCVGETPGANVSLAVEDETLQDYAVLHWADVEVLSENSSVALDEFTPGEFYFHLCSLLT
jgi:hypothetical protein